jgi:HEAT repeat protein
MFGLSPLPRSIEAALRDVRDAKAAVRLSAVSDLALHAGTDERARDALVLALRKDVSAQVRGGAAVALADAKAQVEMEPLLDALSDSNLYVRQMALIALGELGVASDSRVLRVVEDALSDEAPALRFQALIAIAGLFPARAEKPLLAATRDADPEVRHVSLRLLEDRAMADPGAGASDAVVAQVREALDDESRSVRLVAAILLARGGDRTGVPALVEALNHPRARLDAEDEHAAISLAGDLGDREFLPGLRRRAWGAFGVGRHRFAHDALVALAKLGDDRARGAILRGLSAWTRDARTHAVVAAGRARLGEARPVLEAMRGDPSKAEPSAVEEALTALACD